MKRYIAAVLIIAILIQLTGCYSMQEISKEDFVSSPNNSKLIIKTEKKEITFNQGDYSFKNDTIYGLGSSPVTFQPFEGTISMYDVEKIEIEKASNQSDTANVFVTAKGNQYIFKNEKNYCTIKNDSLYGIGVLVNNSGETFYGSIGLDDVNEIQIEEFNIGNTFVLVCLVVGIAVGIAAAIFASSYHLDFGD